MLADLPTLHTARLTLRPFVLHDADTVQMLAGDYTVYRTTANLPHPYEAGMAERWIVTHAHEFYQTGHVTLAITLAATGELIGCVGLINRAQHQQAELGYWIGVPYWGQGYATEAVQAVIQYGFSVMDLHKIKARHLAMNTASGRVMQKAGMHYEATLRDDVLKDGVYHDVLQYAIWQNAVANKGV